MFFSKRQNEGLLTPIQIRIRTSFYEGPNHHARGIQFCRPSFVFIALRSLSSFIHRVEFGSKKGFRTRIARRPATPRRVSITIGTFLLRQPTRKTLNCSTMRSVYLVIKRKIDTRIFSKRTLEMARDLLQFVAHVRLIRRIPVVKVLVGRRNALEN